MEDNIKPSTEEAFSNSEDQGEEAHQGMFAQRFAAVMDDFGAACEKNKIATSVAIAIHPDERDPLVFLRGDLYETARLLAFVLKQLKQEIYVNLDSEPR